MAALSSTSQLAASMRTWRRSVTSWKRGWTEPEVLEAVSAFHEVAESSRTLVAEVHDAVQHVLDAPNDEALGERAERVRTLMVQIEALDAEARAAVDAVAGTIRDARDARLERREALIQRQAEVDAASARIEAVLGRSSARRRIPLFEKGLAVARLRGDNAVLVGWLLDTADLYAQVGRGDEAITLLTDALERTEDSANRMRARILLRLAREELRLSLIHISEPTRPY